MLQNNKSRSIIFLIQLLLRCFYRSIKNRNGIYENINAVPVFKLIYSVFPESKTEIAVICLFVIAEALIKTICFVTKKLPKPSFLKSFCFSKFGSSGFHFYHFRNRRFFLNLFTNLCFSETLRTPNIIEYYFFTGFISSFN